MTMKHGSVLKFNALVSAVTMLLQVLLLLSFTSTTTHNNVVVVEAVPADMDENCPYWSTIGECEKNPGYMIAHCATSCFKVAKQALADAEELKQIETFFDLKDINDIHGNPVDFEQFKGQVTVVVNVASECGYTDSHYKSLVQLSKQLSSSPNPVNILAFPCNQFGQQEPGKPDDILGFVNDNYAVDTTSIKIMSKVDVNGGDASILYKFLKSKAGPAAITWNFATYYVIGPDGSVESFSGVEPLELKDKILKLAQSSDEL